MAKLGKENVGAVIRVPPFFKDRVVERVLRASLHEGKDSGKQSIKLETELHEPEKVVIGADEYVLAGQKITRYLSLDPEVKSGAKQSGWANTFAFLEKLNLPTELDTEEEGFAKKLADMFEDVAFENILSSQEKAAQRRNEKGGYEPITDGRGQPIKQGFEWNTYLNEVLGPASIDNNKPY